MNIIVTRQEVVFSSMLLHFCAVEHATKETEVIQVKRPLGSPYNLVSWSVCAG